MSVGSYSDVDGDLERKVRSIDGHRFWYDIMVGWAGLMEEWVSLEDEGG